MGLTILELSLIVHIDLSIESKNLSIAHNLPIHEHSLVEISIIVIGVIAPAMHLSITPEPLVTISRHLIGAVAMPSIV